MSVRVFTPNVAAADRPPPRERLVCLPQAGGGAAMFRNWADWLGADVEIVVPCLPGRDARARLAPQREMAGLVARLADDLTGFLDRPYGLYGHSLGALVAFDLARELARRRGPAPTALIVSGQRAPSLPYPRAAIFHLPDSQFLTEIQTRYEPLPAAVLADAEARAFYLRMLRADFTLAEDYRYVRAPPLFCPIRVIRGAEDHGVEPEHVAGWARESVADCRFDIVQGGHFFPRDRGDDFREILRAALTGIDGERAQS